MQQSIKLITFSSELARKCENCGPAPQFSPCEIGCKGRDALRQQHSMLLVAKARKGYARSEASGGHPPAVYLMKGAERSSAVVRLRRRV